MMMTLHMRHVLIPALMAWMIGGLCACTSETASDLVGENGRGPLTIVFSPGMEVGGEVVRKTFQPSYVVTSNGTTLAFCQGRLKEGGDNEVKVILMNKSSDFGRTWQGVEVLSGPMNHFAMSPWVAEVDGRERVSFLTCVGLKVTKEYYRYDYALMQESTGIDIGQVGRDKPAVLCRYYSDDDGNTWTMETLTGEKTPLYKNHDGYVPVFVNTIGQVHKIPEGPFAGRLIMAVPVYSAHDTLPVTDNFRNHASTGSGVLVSDDMGASWRMEGMIVDFMGNEASAVSIDGGKAILMIRRYADRPEEYAHLAKGFVPPGIGERIAHKSVDGGKTWSEPFMLPLSDIKCHGTLARVGDRLYFSIPSGRRARDLPREHWDDDRVRGAIYFSDDWGASWNHRVLEEGFYSYSTVGQLHNEYLIAFFSRGGHGRFGIGCRVFTDRWLEQ
jgi:sialidase-1